MIEANIVEAKTKLSQLVEAAERGEQVYSKEKWGVGCSDHPDTKGQFALRIFEG